MVVRSSGTLRGSAHRISLAAPAGIFAAAMAVLFCACRASSSEPSNSDSAVVSEADPPPASGGATRGDPDRPAPTPSEATDASTAEPNRYVDTCDGGTAACTAPPAGFTEGSGLVAVDRCAHMVRESAGLGAPHPLVEALARIAPRVSVAAVLDAANRTTSKGRVTGSPPGVSVAFGWDRDDADSTRWIPQGITGTADADPSGTVSGRRSILVSFYDANAEAADAGVLNEGVRVAFVDMDRATPTYRFAMLVEPSGTVEAPTFAPVQIHAGGIVWFGNYLYVADTSNGFRVFDMRSILEIDTTIDAFGCTPTACHAGKYRFVIPQVGLYRSTPMNTACKNRYSFVSLDRTTNPPSLLSGEYCAATACADRLSGRVFRWPLDAATGRLRSADTYPTEAFFMGQAQAQGAASVNGTYYLSSSAPSGGAGALYRVKGSKSVTSSWINMPEDLMVDGKSGLLYSLSEGAGERVVVGVQLSSYPDP